MEAMFIVVLFEFSGAILSASKGKLLFSHLKIKTAYDISSLMPLKWPQKDVRGGGVGNQTKEIHSLGPFIHLSIF